MSSVTIIVVPYHVGVANYRVGAGPQAILEAGLLPGLERQNFTIDCIHSPAVHGFEGEVGRSFELLRKISTEVSKAAESGSFPIVLAGNCHTSVGVSSGLESSDHGIIWLDAHEDYHTPETLQSGYFDAMGVSMLVGESWSALCKSIPGYTPLTTDKVVFCGLRDVTEVEQRRVRDAGFKVVWGCTDKRVDFRGELEQHLTDVPFSQAMLHLDLDCLDVSFGKANQFAAPGGLLEHHLQGIISLLRSNCPPVSLTVASFDPSLEGGPAIAAVAVRAICATVLAVLD